MKGGEKSPLFFAQGIGMTEKEINLAGKDFFNELEAAHYCCVSPSQFREHILEYGVLAREFMGKKIYDRGELYKVMQKAKLWPQSIGAVKRRTSIGAMPDSNTGFRSERLLNVRRRVTVKQSRLN